MNFLIENLLYIISLVITLVVWLGATFIWVERTNTNIKHLQDGVEEVKDDLKSGLSSVQADIKKLFERLPPPKNSNYFQSHEIN